MNLILAFLLLQAMPPAPATPAESPIITTASGCASRRSCPARPARADAVQVMYEVRLARSGRLVELTRTPAGIPVAGSIAGFTEALLLMNEGGRYRFWVPARLAYGRRGSRRGAAHADLVFT